MVVVCSAAGALPNRVPLWGDGRRTSVEPFISQRLYKIAHSGQKVVWQKFTLKSDNHEPRPVDADGRGSSYPFARGLQVGKVQRNPRPCAVKRAARVIPGGLFICAARVLIEELNLRVVGH